MEMGIIICKQQKAENLKIFVLPNKAFRLKCIFVKISDAPVTKIQIIDIQATPTTPQQEGIHCCTPLNKNVGHSCVQKCLYSLCRTLASVQARGLQN